MVGNPKVTMTMRELDRLKCIQGVIDGKLKPSESIGRSILPTTKPVEPQQAPVPNQKRADAGPIDSAGGVRSPP